MEDLLKYINIHTSVRKTTPLWKDEFMVKVFIAAGPLYVEQKNQIPGYEYRRNEEGVKRLYQEQAIACLLDKIRLGIYDKLSAEDKNK